MDATLRTALVACVEPGSLVLIVHGTDEQPAELAVIGPDSRDGIPVRDDASLLVAALLHLTSRVQAIEVEMASTRPAVQSPVPNPQSHLPCYSWPGSPCNA